MTLLYHTRRYLALFSVRYCLKHFQMQGAEKYIFAFYPRKTGDVEFVQENFISTLKCADNPISEGEADKIQIDFLDNRTLSPIETGGAQ